MQVVQTPGLERITLMRKLTLGPTTTPTFRSVTMLGAVFALATLAACTDNTAPSTRIAGGAYALSTVNATGLPYSYSVGSTTVTIDSDVYTLQSNGDYSETIDETISNGVSSSPASDAESGTWTQNGNAIVFYPSYSTQGNTSQYTGSLTSGGTFSHSSLTFSYNGVVWVYNHT
jgi:hypothetical protein